MQRDPEKFVDAILDHFLTGEGGELDYSDFLDIGIECGVLLVEPYEPKGKHEHLDVSGDVEPGDPIYVLAPHVRRLSHS